MFINAANLFHDFFPVTLTALGLFVSGQIFLLNRRNATTTTSVSIMKQMQDYNLAVARDDALAAQMQAGELFGRSLPWIRELYATFYQLNIIHDSWFASRSGLISRDHTLRNTAEILCILAVRSPTQLEYILNGKRGYDAKFKAYLRSQLEASAKEHRVRFNRTGAFVLPYGHENDPSPLPSPTL